MAVIFSFVLRGAMMYLFYSIGAWILFLMLRKPKPAATRKIGLWFGAVCGLLVVFSEVSRWK